MEGMYILGVALMAPILVIPIVLYIFFKNAGSPSKSPDRVWDRSERGGVKESPSISDASDANADHQNQSPRTLVLFVALGAALPAVFFIGQIFFDSSVGAAEILGALVKTAFWGAVGMVIGAIIWDSSG